MVVVFESGDWWRYEQGLNLLLNAADFPDEVSHGIFLKVPPLTAWPEELLKKMKQLELFEVDCVALQGRQVPLVLPFVREVTAAEIAALLDPAPAAAASSAVPAAATAAAAVTAAGTRSRPAAVFSV